MSLEIELSEVERNSYAKSCWFCDPNYPHPKSRSACIYCCKWFDIIKQLIGFEKRCPGADVPHHSFPAGRGFNNTRCERCN